MALKDFLSGVVRLVAGIHGFGVASYGVVTVNIGVFAGKVRLVEVVGMGDVGAPETGLKDNGSIGSDEHGNTASSTGGTSITLLVESNVTSNNDGVSAIPAGGLYPVDAIEKSIGSAVAGVDGVDTLDVGVARGSKELHQHGLDGLGLVQHGLCADLEASNRLGVDGVFAEE